ncbi:MAG: DHH family phosphoesterase [Spirochaetes bacterium]|nr:DHH family phosphoesterase [Spirochaetota bacterium]
MNLLTLDRNRISKAGKVCIVMGNEAADLDSMASSVLYALLKSRVDPDPSHIYLPFAPIPKEDFKLRTEAVYLFKEAGVGQDALLFAGELELHPLQKDGRLSLILMDHNKLSKDYTAYEGFVEEIIDHHKDEGCYAQAKVRKIEPVGSTCTLVAEEYLRLAPQLLSRREAMLLLGTILLDTVNLDPKAGRVTPKDTEIANTLKPKASIDSNTLFETLQREKFNVSDLTTADLLRKDYKEYMAGKIRYGMSTVLISLDTWKKKDPLLQRELEAYRRERKLDLLVVMIAYTEPKFQRELVLSGESETLIASLVEYLNAKGAQLVPIGFPGGYTQGNAEYSRKKLQPLVQEFLASSVG